MKDRLHIVGLCYGWSTVAQSVRYYLQQDIGTASHLPIGLEAAERSQAEVDVVAQVVRRLC